MRERVAKLMRVKIAQPHGALPRSLIIC
jgi:hypothetical protein